MNLWFILSLLVPVAWGFANVLDAVSRRHFIKNDTALTWFLAVTRLPVIAGIVLFAGFHPAETSVTLFMFFAGILWMVPFILYYRAMEFEEPSIVILILQTMPVFIYFIAYAMLGETLTQGQWMGFVVLLLGGFLAAIKRLEGMWHVSKALWIMLLASIFWSFSDVLFKKYSADFLTFWDALAVYLAGGAFAGIAMMARSRDRAQLVKHFAALSPRGWSFIIITQIIGLGGTIALTYAFVLGKVSLTSVVSGIQPLVVFGAGFMLSRFLPEVKPESTDRTSLTFKTIAFFLTLGGLVLLYIS
jgi:drug/metabolite transporter (DMT)-like permease